MKRIRDIEEAYDLLKEVRDIWAHGNFKNFDRCVKKIDKLIKREEG